MTYDHQLALVLRRVRPRDPNTILRWVSETGVDLERKQADNIAAMHRMHGAGVHHKRLPAGCFAVWSEYGTIPDLGKAGWHLERFSKVGDATDAFIDRVMQPGKPLDHEFITGTVKYVAPVTPLSRLWIYRYDPQGVTNPLPTYGYERDGDGYITVKPDAFDNELRQIIEAEQRHRDFEERRQHAVEVAGFSEAMDLVLEHLGGNLIKED